MDESVKNKWIAFIEKLQDAICAALEEGDAGGKYNQDNSQREGGGGGKTRVWKMGKFLKKPA